MRGLSSVAFKCKRITQDNPGCLSNSVFKTDIYTKMSELKGWDVPGIIPGLAEMSTHGGSTL